MQARNPSRTMLPAAAPQLPEGIPPKPLPRKPPNQPPLKDLQFPLRMSTDARCQNSVATTSCEVSESLATALFKHLVTFFASAEIPPNDSKIIG